MNPLDKIDFSLIFSHPIYIVGGAVRNYLFNEEIDDIDLASNLTPQQFKEKCTPLKIKTIDTGIQHGTVSFIYNKKQYEHTTFRNDVSCDGRNATISFSKTIEEDLSRRDFTINAIAYLQGKFIDPFNGKKDIEQKKLRTVGDAYTRFQEDYLRIIRMFRFTAKFNLNICPKSLEASFKLKDFIRQKVSPERITDEIKKSHFFSDKFFLIIEKNHMLDVIFPHLKEYSLKQINIIKQFLACVPKTHRDFIWVSLFFFSGNIISKLIKNFRLSNQQKKLINMIIKEHNKFLLKKNLTIENLYPYGEKYKEDLFLLFDFIHIIKKENKYENYTKNQIKKILNVLNNPIITGNDLINEGLKPNKNFKEKLTQAGILQVQGYEKKKIMEKIKE